MRLVRNAGSWWRWFSMQAMGLCVALQGAWMAVPDDLKGELPGWAFNGLCAALLLLGMIGRVVKQGDDDA
jgi:hypothetical protein